MGARKVNLPLTEETISQLEIGEEVLLSGVMYGARDAAHKKMVASLTAGEGLPVDLKGQTIYYVGPCPAKPGAVIGSAGPTTSGRMDAYAPVILDLGLKAMIGKGQRSPEVVAAMVKNKAVYLGAVGGAGALLAQCIKKAEVVAYSELGPEALWRFVVEDFPVMVIIDAQGYNLYVEGPKGYERRK